MPKIECVCGVCVTCTQKDEYLNNKLVKVTTVTKPQSLRQAYKIAQQQEANMQGREGK